MRTLGREGLTMLEKEVEHKLVLAVRMLGGMCLKFVSPGMSGVPDRLVLLPGGKAAFVELKAPGKKPRPLQLYCHDRLRALGFRVYVLDRPSGIPELITDLIHFACPDGYEPPHAS